MLFAQFQGKFPRSHLKEPNLRLDVHFERSLRNAFWELRICLAKDGAGVAKDHGTAMTSSDTCSKLTRCFWDHT